LTYSIVARDAETGQFGVAVQSHWFSVGSRVCWAEAGVGAVATQALSEPGYGGLGITLMRAGTPAKQALRALLGIDEEAQWRQVAMVDRDGEVAVHTGRNCVSEAGHATEVGISVQANMMSHATVWVAMLQAYLMASGSFAERLIVALEAAEGAGGDIRGRQSAALLIVSAESTGRPWADRIVDLRVDDNADPLVELRRLLSLRSAYDGAARADEASRRDDLDAAVAEIEAARRLVPESEEMTYRHAMILARHGHISEARSILTPLIERQPGWAEFVRRLPAAGLLPDSEVVARLLG
jgi:uncharacterized Ntn-hydrolase superfamily protein